MKTRDTVFAAAAVLGGIAGAVVAARVAEAYQRDQRITRAQLAALSDVIETARGPVEVAEAGDGPVVLFAHGGGGGFDQGLHCVSFLGDAGVRFVVPSRFGYLRSPMPPNATPEAQADAFAALLDALNVERAAVMAVSAGGMTAVNFALRHPDRCWGLVLVSAATRPLTMSTPLGQTMGELLYNSDFALWALSTYLPGLTLASTGFSAADEDRLAAQPEARRAIRGMLRLDPASRRRDGMLNDLVQGEVLPLYPLERITAPTLVIHGTHDPLVPFYFGAYAASAIPDARFLILEGAGHLAWFTHAGQTRPAALEFFAAHAPTM